MEIPWQTIFVVSIEFLFFGAFCGGYTAYVAGLWAFVFWPFLLFFFCLKENFQCWLILAAMLHIYEKLCITWGNIYVRWMHYALPAPKLAYESIIFSPCRWKLELKIAFTSSSSTIKASKLRFWSAIYYLWFTILLIRHLVVTSFSIEYRNLKKGKEKRMWFSYVLGFNFVVRANLAQAPHIQYSKSLIAWIWW